MHLPRYQFPVHTYHTMIQDSPTFSHWFGVLFFLEKELKADPEEEPIEGSEAKGDFVATEVAEARVGEIERSFLPFWINLFYEQKKIHSNVKYVSALLQKWYFTTLA